VILPEGGALVSALLVLVLGLVACFLGYRLFASFISLYGFLIGAGLGLALAGRLLPGNDVAAVIAVVVLGLIGAVVVRFLYWLVIFVIGAGAGAVLVQAAAGAMGQPAPMLLVIVAAIIVGILALVFQHVAIILITAFAGAWAVVSGAVALITGQPITLTGAFTPPAVERWSSVPVIALVVWLVLGLVGAAYQFRTTAEPAPRRARGRRRAL
jgi:hypothetical protein